MICLVPCRTSNGLVTIINYFFKVCFVGMGKQKEIESSDDEKMEVEQLQRKVTRVKRILKLREGRVEKKGNTDKKSKEMKAKRKK